MEVGRVPLAAILRPRTLSFLPRYHETTDLLPTHSSNVQCCLGLKASRESNFGMGTSESLDHSKPFLLLCGMYPGFCYSNENG